MRSRPLYNLRLSDYGAEMKKSCRRSVERSLTVANDSVVRKPDAFHLISSIMPGAEARMAFLTAVISTFNGFANAATKPSTSLATAAPTAAGFLFGFTALLGFFLRNSCGDYFGSQSPIIAPVGSEMMLSQPMPSTSVTSLQIFAPSFFAFLVALSMSATST